MVLPKASIDSQRAGSRCGPRARAATVPVTVTLGQHELLKAAGDVVGDEAQPKTEMDFERCRASALPSAGRDRVLVIIWFHGNNLMLVSMETL